MIFIVVASKLDYICYPSIRNVRLLEYEIQNLFPNDFSKFSFAFSVYYAVSHNIIHVGSGIWPT